MDYTRFFNKICLARKMSPLRELPELMKGRPNLINMAGGLPDPQTFPFTEATITLRDGSQLHIPEGDMRFALQYSDTKGFSELLDWVRELQRRVHNPPAMGDADTPGQVDCIIVNGNQDAICKVFESLVSPGDNVMVESPIYPGPMNVLRPMGCNILPVQSDHQGIIPDSLRHILSRWSPADAKDPNSNIPKVLYCVPSGGNPMGSGLTLERKKEIYGLAQEYDLMILEDDPYYYIQFTDTLVPSFLSLDVDGRVIRFDSFSKVISPGARLGYLTAPKPVIEKIVLHVMCSTMHPCGISEMIVLSLLKKWGHDGFLAHAKKNCELYKEKCRQCLKIAEKHLTGLAEWKEPTGGMFIWLKLLHITDTYKLAREKLYLKDVLFVPGNAFYSDISVPSQYVRASFSVASVSEMDQAFSRFAETLKEELPGKAQ